MERGRGGVLLRSGAGGVVDWRAKLRDVLVVVDKMKAVPSALYFPLVKDTLQNAVTKIIKFDLADRDDWGTIHSLLKVCIALFSGLQYFPGSVGGTFAALYNGLNSEKVKYEEWGKIVNRDAKIVEIMHSMGNAIKTIPGDNISSIIGAAGVEQMRSIGGILTGKEPIGRGVAADEGSAFSFEIKVDMSWLPDIIDQRMLKDRILQFSGTNIWGAASKDRWPIQLRINDDRTEVSVVFENGKKFTAAIAEAQKEEYENFIKWHNEDKGRTAVRFRGFSDKCLNFEIRSEGAVAFVYGSGDGYRPSQNIDVKFTGDWKRIRSDEDD
jgi:hypothetical protein